MQQKKDNRVSGEGFSGGKMVEDNKSREKEKNVGKTRKARVFMGDSIIRKVDKIVNRGDDITVCLQNRGCSREGRTGHGTWHGRCCFRASGNEQCREGGYVGHRW